MSRTALGIVLAIAIATAAAGAQTPAPVAGVAVDPVAAAADAAAQKLIAAKHVPGVAIGVSEGGRLFVRGYGVADTGSRVPVTPDTRFEIGSITKQITAACVLQLVEAHRLSLDDRLGTFVSDYFVGRGITVRQLLEQESGIPEFLQGDDVVAAAGTQPATYATLLARVSDKPLEFVPGTRWRYSNTNYILLGRIVELAAHEPYERYVRTHVFEPAGMTHSGFIGDERTLPAMARGYVPSGKGAAPAPPLRDDWAGSAGAVVSTVGDVIKWDDALLGGKIVTPADVKLMRTAATIADGTSTHYGFGWIVDEIGTHPRAWHNGGTFGFHAVNETFPNDGETIVILANATVDVEGLVQGIFAATHGDVAQPLGPASGEAPAITARLRDTLHRLQTNDIDRTQLTETMSKRLTQPLLDNIAQQLGPLGMPESVVFRGMAVSDGVTRYDYVVAFASESFTVEMSIDAAGKIAGFFVKPD